ncbi:MAG TPA: PAS domain S-box protein, partial [Thermoanaerobaculia bacterium]
MSIVCAAIVVGVALCVLFGWAYDLSLLRRGFAGTIDIRPNTAVALLVAGAGIFLLQSRVSRLIALVPVAIGLVTLTEYLLNRDLGVDSLLFTTYDPHVTLRMSLRAAIEASLSGFALLMAPRRAIAQSLAAATAFIATLSVIAYLYGAHFLPHAGISPIALSTAILFLLWSVAFLARTSESAVVATLLRADEWGDTTRRLSLVALVAPGVIGALCLIGANRELFDVPFAVAIVTTATSATLIVTIARYTSRLRDHETQRITADALYRTIVETSQEGICVVDATMRFTFVNEHLATMLGYKADELIGQHVNTIVPPEERPGVEQRAATRRANGTATRTTVRLVHRDGSFVHAISSATQVAAA